MYINNFFKTTVLLFALFFCYACSDVILTDDQVMMQEDTAIPDKETFVSAEQAKEIAEAFFSRQSEGTIEKSSLKSFVDVSVETIKDQGNPLMYVINHPERGWTIVSATRNYFPVLAYSEEGSFELKSDEEMGPVIVWIEETKEAIRLCEGLDNGKKAEISSMWNEFEADRSQVPSGSTLKRYDPMEDACGARMLQLYQQYGSSGWHILQRLSNASSYFDYYEYQNLCNLANNLGSPPEYTIVMMKKYNTTQTIGPLLTTQWHQRSPFIKSSLEPAGCVTVAMAQIMKFHRFPNLVTSPTNHRYNWDNMQDIAYYTNPTTSSTPVLMEHIKDALFTSGSTSFDFSAKNNFQNTYKYTANLKDYVFENVRDEINVGRPVYLSGHTNSILGIPAGDGHAWVCDGYSITKYITDYFIEFINPYSYTYSTQGYYTPSNPGASTISYAYFHMNWGWVNSSKPDGWFATNS